jgi:menaquinone-dependent protoporphyrinogen oxidase
MAGERILIVYGTRYGQTAKVAGRIAEVLRRRGCAVTLDRGDALPPDLDLGAFDGVMVGASYIMGRHQSYVERFIRAHREALGRLPSAFFSVSGSAGSPRPEEREAARRNLDQFLAPTGWQPAITKPVAGAIAYTQYGPLTRWLMKQIARSKGASTDTSRDHESTDWPAVEQFATEFAGLVERSRPAVARAG